MHDLRGAGGLAVETLRDRPESAIRRTSGVTPAPVRA